MYGDNDYDYGGNRESPRPLSFISSPLNHPIEQGTNAYFDSRLASSRSPPARTNSNDRLQSTPNGQSITNPRRQDSNHRENGSPSPTRTPMRDRSPSDTANTQFPLNDVGYESSPAAVAQELSNLQALRRMSMDVNATGDPDLPAFNTSYMPPVAPTASSDEDDESRLFWVPARLHPELAPTEFKTFLETRVGQIKRRADGSLSPDGLSRQGSGSSSLKRKKSMLSKQIDTSTGKAADDYKDGADVLEKKRSLSGQYHPDVKMADLAEDLNDIVKDPTRLMRKLSIDTQQSGLGNDGDVILPSAPPQNQLKRTMHTRKGRGGSKRGGRLGNSKRYPLKADTDTEDSPTSPSVTSGGSDVKLGLTRVQTEPTPSPRPEAVDNFSRPRGSQRGRAIPPGASSSSSFDDILKDPKAQSPTSFQQRVIAEKELMARGGKYTTPPEVLAQHPVPQIVETPPPPEEDEPGAGPSYPQQAHLPERTSSHDPPSSQPPQGPLPHGPPSTGRSGKRPPIRHASNTRKGDQTLNDIASHPSPLPGSSTRTDSLSFIPTFAEDKKAEKKQKEKKEKDSSDNASTTSRKSSWGWLLGSEDKHQSKEKDKSSSKNSKANDKSHDNTRLDLLQTSIDGGRSRESLVLDREGLKLEEERKKESSRKSSGSDSKKEKDGIFSSFWGKKKGDKDSSGKKHNSRGLSPEPPHKLLKPDKDYNWTRFSLVEERAIYRLAHMKLANPRRALYSQVLLSNFMYSYLAKVQQMHPQTPAIGTSQPKTTPQQQQAQQPVTQQEQDAQQDQQDNQYYQYHEQAPDSGNYIDDAQIYDYDHPDPEPTPPAQAPRTTDPSSTSKRNRHKREPPPQQPHHQQASRDDDMW
ncbi:MAG: hypothetical protein M1824_005079 [Vezdaea acicularis]|nr:MAG: hypothetical protein M1824_005079 [Vezdaea acicularis]